MNQQITPEKAKEEIKRLAAKYNKALAAKSIKKYNEASTKSGFIQPLFEALGWDFSNLDEVEAEKTITPGRVDYVFKVNGVSKFCLEAKSLHTDINDERWVKQAIGYAYNKGVTWAVLTNFKVLRAFNAQRETRDISQIGFLNLSCERFVSDFQRLWLLSRQAVSSSALDKEAEAYGALPPRLGVEKRLYAQLTGWRETLFNEVYLHYKDKGFSWSQVDWLIQQLLNRFIFIRTAEDRGLVDRKLLAALHQWQGSEGKAELIESLRDIFHDFASTYDSDLFPPAMDPWDSISPYSQTLADIIHGLYEIPGGLAAWDFATIGANVLGAVYEQYLGYVPEWAKREAKEAQQRLFPIEPHIEITAKKQKRKREGIYYTPPWVVDYIVKQTVGRFIEEHSYNDIFNIKILDPACGSGSFLTRAYEELLSYHARVKGKSPADLNQSERQRILLGNIFGVDLDNQAVEIAKLSLLLCSLAGQETLPSLADNIRQGNSLISGTDEELRHYFGDGWEEKHRFNWEQEFKEIMKDGGFDVVIGNPPWVFTRDVDLGESAKRYFSDHYVGAKGKVNSYALFLWRGVNLLNSNGLFSMIIPNTFLRATTYEDLRRNLLSQYCVLEISDAGPDVFPGVTASTVIPLIKKGKQSLKIQINTLDKTGKATLMNSVDTKRVLENPAVVVDIYADDAFHQIADRVSAICQPLSAYIGYLISGIQTWKQHKSNFIANRRLTKDYKPLLEGKDIGRYQLSFADRYIFYDRKVLNVMQDESIFLLKEKILIQRVSGGAQPIKATLDRDSFYTFNSINTLVCRGLDNRYTLGCLNSKFMNWFYYNKFTNRSSLTVNISARFLKQLPIRRIDFDNPVDKKMHDELVALVDRMLELNRQLAPIRNTPCHEQDELLREIKHTDRQIDNLVYDLYGLTEEERKIVEESTG